MENDWVIKVENVSKKFARNLRHSIAYGFIDTLKTMVGLDLDETKLRNKEFWALQNINFELRKGESLALIGRNGCGKSTLLRVIHGIYPPSIGKISIKGRVGALIAVGAGFYPQMTGYENIYLNGAIMGMDREEIDAKIHDIIAFSEIGDFIQAPVSSYSSGMVVRLGFAIAVHMDVDILLADEVLAVGDYQFQIKCLNKIREIKEKGCSIVFVSHSEQMVRSVCERAVVFQHGKQLGSGKTDDMLDLYRQLVLQDERKGLGSCAGALIGDSETAPPVGRADILSFKLSDETGPVFESPKKTGETIFSDSNALKFELEIETNDTLNNCRFSLFLGNMQDRQAMAYPLGASYTAAKLEKGRYKVTINLDISSLTPNAYTIVFAMADQNEPHKIYAEIGPDDELFFMVKRSEQFVEENGTRRPPFFMPPADCRIVKTD